MKTNKKLKVAIGIVIAIIVLAILGVTTITKNHALAAHTHEWVQGSGSHTCSICGLSEECDFVTNYSNIDETYHWTQKCSKCGAVKGIAKHNTQWKNDSTYHWEECKDCGAIIHKGNHVYHSSNPGVCMQMECAYQCKHPGQTGSTCSICYKSLNTYTPCLHTSGYKYEGFQSGGVYKHEVICNDSSCPNYGSTINIVNCTRGPWIQTDNLHLVGCSVCYQKMEQGDHVDANNDGKCDVCSYEMEVKCTHPSSKVEWKYNETSHWQYCNECKKDITEKVSHDIIMNEVYSPTCTEKGYTHHQCKCGYEYITDEIPALGHNYGSWIVTKSATCTTEGEETRTCTRCGNKETRKTNKIAHTIVTDSKIEATCTQTGKTEGKHCSVCGEVIIAQTEIPALGHNFGGWVVTKPATCTSEGEAIRTCSRCPEKEMGRIDKLEHTVVIDSAVSATCTEKGKTEGSHCSECGETIIAQKEVPALGHNYKVESDNGNGTHTEKCTRCGDTKNVNHEYDEEGKCICGAVQNNDTNTNTENNENTEIENNNNENTNTETENNNNNGNTNTETENNNNNENTNTETENNNNNGNTNIETENNNNNENTKTDVSKQESSKTENNGQTTKNIPFTGENTTIMISIGMLVFAGFGVLAIIKYKGI